MHRKYNHMHLSPPCFGLYQVQTHTHALLVSLPSQKHTHRCLRERKPTEREKHLSQDERLHTHCLHAESLPTPSRDSAYCSRGLCYADILQLASLPTPINAATQLHPCLSFAPFTPLLLYCDATVADREQKGCRISSMT